jgi:hypothetical protein
MLKKSLIAIAVLAIAMPALAGTIKVHDPWPTTLVPQQVAVIDVVLDVGYYVHIKDQKPIKVVQCGNMETYCGCKKTDAKANFEAQLIPSIGSASAAGGNWSATITPNVINGSANIEICVEGKKVNIGNLAGGAKGIKVAELTIKVLPN